MAGLVPEDGRRFERVTKRPAWLSHRAEFDRNWLRLERERITALRAWRDRELRTPEIDGTLTLFGRYTPPVGDVNYGLQKDLAAAYQQSSIARDLPFSFGYHWRQGTSSVMLAVRKTDAH